MAEIKNSKTLDMLIEYAKSFNGSTNAALNAERFFIAVIDFLDGNIDIDDSESQNKLCEFFLVAGLKLEHAREKLADYINNKTDSSYLDGLYMQKKLYEAKTLAQNEGLSELTPDVVVRCIISDPGETLKTCLSLKTEEAENKAAVQAPAFEEDADAHASQEEKNDPLDDLLKTKFPEFSGKPAEKDKDKKAEADPKLAVSMLIDKVKSTQDILLKSIYGQDNAVSIFTSGYFQAELLSMTDKSRKRPSATFLFAGPPGVGKTFLAEKAAEVLKLPFMRFDMSEYSDKEANIEFCGSDKVYKSAKEGNVTGFVASHPKSILLFDEIEKANICVIHLFLQILDAGRLRDNYTDREVSFKDTIIIFTTNAGRQLYENSESGDFSGISRKVILKTLEREINPSTGAPFFPAAICSRFASGNVIMFNHISANNLREIAKREVLRHSDNFANEIGMNISIDERVYTSLLFAEGGNADARTIRSRAESFFDDELFELFRLIASESANKNIQSIEDISIEVELPADDPALTALFEEVEKPKALVFSSGEVTDACQEKADCCDFVNVQSIGEAVNILKKSEVSIVIIDLSLGINEKQKYLNVEDVESPARDFLRYIRENHRELPVYLLQTQSLAFNPEEKLSFLRQGVRDIIDLDSKETSFAQIVKQISTNLHQQKSMMSLAKSNKIVTFETAQLISENGKHATIKLFDFEVSVAVDAEDTQNILSNVSKPNVRFNEVIGAEDAKKELQYFVEYLKNPKKYLGTGVSAPKGVLLYGPPGTGKTMLAKAMASESDVTFITAEGNQFLKKYVGEGSDKVHELFRTARKYAPSILFIDEIDAIAKERRGGENAQGSEATLTAFLTEMDGFKQDTAKPVFILAATNYNVEPGGDKSLDPAMMRRFDRRVYIDLPNRDERMRYMRMRFAENSAFELSDDKIENIAIRSTGMSLAELASIIELSLRTAIRSGELKVTDDIFDEAFETFNSGETKHWDISQLERVARHEAGHTLLCWHSGEAPSYVTVVARGEHGGYMQHDDHEGKAIYTKDELLAKIRTSLGGRAAEIVYYGEKDGISTGASGDLASATNMARHIICTYGMDENFGLAVIDQQAARTGEISGEVRGAINKILSDELENAVRIISENKKAIDALVEQLLSLNHLTGNEIKNIFESNCSANG